MTKEYTFLGHFITEEIYLVDSEPSKSDESDVDKKILIISEPLSAEEKTFLQKIFAAIDIVPDQLKIVNSENSLGHKHSLVLYFGIQPSVSYKAFYEINKVKDSMVIVAHSLSEIAHDDSRKRELWDVLKSCFN